MTDVLLDIFVPGDPKPQPRPRAFSRNGSARVYDPATAEGWKSCIADAVRLSLPMATIEGPVAVEMNFQFRRPKGHYRGVNRSVVRVAAPAFHVQRPDLDNLAKAVLDALTTLGLWRDDSQVVQMTSTKAWSDVPGLGLQVCSVERNSSVLRALGCKEIEP